MASKKVVETIYGKKSKYEVVRKSSAFSTTFYVKKDDKVASGKFNSLAKAVEWAENNN